MPPMSSFFQCSSSGTSSCVASHQVLTEPAKLNTRENKRLQPPLKKKKKKTGQLDNLGT